MNFYGFYNLQPAFNIDLKELRKRYYEKSKALHPDGNTHHDVEQEDLVYLTALNNQAFQTLSDPALRLKYLLDNEFLNQNPEHSRDEPEFIIEMIELHEQIEEAILNDDQDRLDEAKMKLEKWKEWASEKASDSLKLFNEGKRNQEIQSAMLSYYNQLKYFSRLQQILDQTIPDL